MTPDKKFNHVSLPFAFPDLQDITTPDRKRVYITPSGRKYPSITTLLGQIPNEGIATWRARIGDTEANKQMSQAARRGTGLHKIAEQYILNNPDYLEYGDTGHHYLFRSAKPYLNKIDNIVAAEQTLYSDYLQLAGRCDLIADYGGKRAIIDFKTAKKLKKREWITNYFLQATFYSLAFEELFKIKIPNIVIIFAHDDGSSFVFEEKRNNFVKQLIQVNKQYRGQIISDKEVLADEHSQTNQALV